MDEKDILSVSDAPMEAWCEPVITLWTRTYEAQLAEARRQGARDALSKLGGDLFIRNRTHQECPWVLDVISEHRARYEDKTGE